MYIWRGDLRPLKKMLFFKKKDATLDLEKKNKGATLDPHTLLPSQN
jgi:hypothetical protein